MKEKCKTFIELTSIKTHLVSTRNLGFIDYKGTIDCRGTNTHIFLINAATGVMKFLANAGTCSVALHYYSSNLNDFPSVNTLHVQYQAGGEAEHIRVVNYFRNI